MNPKIKELAEKCRESYPDTEWPDAMRYRFDEEKFAELIIQECAIALNTIQTDSISRRHGVDLIYKHFNIE